MLKIVKKPYYGIDWSSHIVGDGGSYHLEEVIFHLELLAFHEGGNSMEENQPHLFFHEVQSLLLKIYYL